MRLKSGTINPIHNVMRHIRLAPKMLLITVLIGFVVWAVLDSLQTKKLKEISDAYIGGILEKDHQENRIRFDNYVESFHQAAKLIVLLQPFHDYVRSFNTSLPGKHIVKFYSEIPPWLPDASVMRHLPRLHYAFLMDQKGNVRELYQALPNPPPAVLLGPSSLLRQLSHDQSLMTSVEDIPFLLTSESLIGDNGEVKATLMLAATLNNDYLRDVQSAENENKIVALIDDTKNQIIACNRPDILPAGTLVQTLKKKYKITGKSFFDQGSSDLILRFATIMPKSEIEEMSKNELRSERLQRSIMAVSLILSFSLIIIIITRHISRVAASISDFSQNVLKIKHLDKRGGDEIAVLEKEFGHLAAEVIESRELIRKQSEMLLREKTVYLNSIMQSSPLAIAATDLDLRIKYYNPAAEKYFGYSADEVVGKTVTEIHTKEKVDRSRFERAIETVKNKNVYIYNVTSKTKNGICFLESRVSGIWDEDGILMGYVLMSADVTDKKKAEEEIMALAKFPDENPYPVLRIARDGTVLYANEASSTLLNLWECRPSEKVPEHMQESVREIFETGTNREIEVAAESRILSLIIVPMADGAYVNIYGRDVTAKKQLEDKLRNYALELERSNKELELFAAVASHDLQEPLRGVSGFAKLLKKRYSGKLGHDADEFISYIVDGADRMQQLIRDLLDYSKITTRGNPFTPVDCNTALGTALANLMAAIKDSGTAVTFDPLPVVSGDSGQIIRLFQNLIGNAIKYRGDVIPAVHVSAKSTGDEWLFSVADNGIGIDSQHYARIFQIFQRLHKRGEYPGTGIGLSVCKRIVDRHGGRIWVESEPGKGSVFYFTIPGTKGKES